MLQKTIILAMTLAAGIVIGAPAAKAVECKGNHFHYGSSTGGKTKRAALKTAILSWREFTAWEYGVAWAYWRRAASRTVECSKTGGWSCYISGIPCRK